MQKVRPTAPNLNDLVAYDPKYLPAEVYLNANESPYGPPSQVIRELTVAVSEQMFHRYPDPLAKKLRAEIAELHGLKPENVLLGNGGDELILDILLAYGGTGRTLLTAPPSFSSYELDAVLTGTASVAIPRVVREVLSASDNEASSELILGVDERAIIERVSRGDIDVVMLTSPNNPTGDVLEPAFVVELLDATDAVVLIDQAYIDFADPRFDVTGLLADHENLVLLRTFSKAYALAGVRLGYLLASEQVIGQFCKVRQPYSVDVFSVLAGAAVLRAASDIAAQVQESISERERLQRALSAYDAVEVFRSEANFILFKTADARQLWKQLHECYGILLRDFSSAPYLGDCLRVSIGLPAENDRFLVALDALLTGEE